MAHRHMDDVAHLYEKTIPPHVADHYLQKRLAFIQKRLRPGGVIVDVGCGTGLLARKLCEAGYQARGMDESAGMLKACLDTNAIPCVHGDSARLPIKSDSVDAAICVATMHHVVGRDEVKQTLIEMLRIVKPGGWILIWDHNPLNPYWPIFMKRLPQDQEQTRLIPLQELVATLKKTPVVSVKAWRMGLVPDFAPRGLLWFFKALECLVERIPGLRLFCAHNVVLATKAG